MTMYKSHATACNFSQFVLILMMVKSKDHFSANLLACLINNYLFSSKGFALKGRLRDLYHVNFLPVESSVDVFHEAYYNIILSQQLCV